MGLGTWSAIANIPSSRCNISSCSYNSKLYIVGGFDMDESNRVFEYTPSNNTWRELASLPTARYDASTIAYNNKLYCLGGHTYGDPYVKYSIVEIYDIATNKWSSGTIPNLPVQSEDHESVIIGSKWYVVGGNQQTNGSTSKATYMIDLANPTGWTKLADMNIGRNAFAIGVVNGRIIVAGGDSSSGNYTNTVEMYNPNSNRWTLLTNMPTGRRHCGGSVLKNRFYVCGGYNDSPTNINSEVLNNVEEYNPITNTWRSVSSMINARDRMSVATVDNTIYTAGGWDGWFIGKAEKFIPPDDFVDTVPSWFIALTNITLPSFNNVSKENLDYLRTKVNEFRVANGLSAYVWTDPVITKNITPVKATHWNEISQAINEVYNLTGQTHIDTQTDKIIKQTLVSKQSQLDISNRVFNIVRSLRRQ